MGSYVDKALVAGEEVIARAHYHWLNWVVPSLAVLVPCALQIASWIWVGPNTRAWLNYGTVALIVIGFVYFLWQVIRIRATEIAVTDRRFIHKTGWIGRDTTEIELRSIEEVGLKQTIWGRIFGYGTLTVRGTGSGIVVSPGLDDPKIFQKAIQTAQEKLRQRLSVQPGAPLT
jgi:uncharacterized membrane protein YdbT with pleckstrin-like domain